MANIIKLIDTKPTIDWERIELDYRAGLLSLREIAVAQGVSHVSISKRAKKHKWERDLKAKIRAKAEALVTKHEVTKLVTSEKAVTEMVTIETNAKVIADVRIAHRGDINRFRNLTNSMLEELELVTKDNELFRNLGEILIDTADGEEPSEYQKKRMEALNKVLSLSSRVDTLKRLAETLKVLITLEREAYSMDEITPVEPISEKEVMAADEEYWDSYQLKITETSEVHRLRQLKIDKG